MNTAKKMSQKVRSEGLAATSRGTDCNICNTGSAEIWANILDIKSEQYLHPLTDAQYCPICGSKFEDENQQERQCG